MKLSKTLVTKISEAYGLGKVKQTKLVEGGNISHNYVFKTSKGEFIVRVLGYNLKNPYWTRQKKLQYLVIEFLIKNKFPYEVAHFIKDKKGECITKISGNLIEVYPRLKGRTIKRPQVKHVREMAKALAFLHKTIAKMQKHKEFLKNESHKWLAKELQDMKKLEPRTEVDKYMLSHVDTFIKALERGLKHKQTKNPIVCHQDFHPSNILFNKSRLTGILDFENVGYGPRINDFFLNIFDLNQSILFIKEYQKYNKIQKSEIQNLVNNKLLGNCHGFRWAYRGRMKNEKKRLEMLKFMVKKYNKYMELEALLKKRMK
ncbi:MAG: phosphotransferase [archaeon]